MTDKAERKFLHDISSPIAVAQGNIKLMMRRISRDGDNLDLDELKTRLEKTDLSFTKITELIEGRRAEIIAKGQGS